MQFVFSKQSHQKQTPTGVLPLAVKRTPGCVQVSSPAPRKTSGFEAEDLVGMPSSMARVTHLTSLSNATEHMQIFRTQIAYGITTMKMHPCKRGSFVDASLSMCAGQCEGSSVGSRIFPCWDLSIGWNRGRWDTP